MMDPFYSCYDDKAFEICRRKHKKMDFFHSNSTSSTNCTKTAKKEPPETIKIKFFQYVAPQKKSLDDDDERKEMNTTRFDNEAEIIHNDENNGGETEDDVYIPEWTANLLREESPISFDDFENPYEVEAVLLERGKLNKGVSSNFEDGFMSEYANESSSSSDEEEYFDENEGEESDESVGEEKEDIRSDGDEEEEEDDDDDDNNNNENHSEDSSENEDQTNQRLKNNKKDYVDGSNRRENVPDYMYPVDEFDIRKIVSEDIKSLLFSHVLPNDDNVPLFDRSIKSKGSFARDLRLIMDKMKVSKAEKVEEAILLLLKDCFGEWLDHRLPIRRKLLSNGTFKYSSTAKSYQDPMMKANFYSYDCCRKGCVVFVGKHANLRACPSCNLPRLRNCRRCGGGACLDEKKHGSRRPYRTVLYRSIRILILSLLRQPGFLHALSYKNKDRREGQIRDVRDTNSFQTAMELLKQYRLKYFFSKPQNQRLKNNNDIEYVTIYLSTFYDGAQIFKNKTTTFKPLLLRIDNLPPYFSNKRGTGTFLMSIISGDTNTKAEQFIFLDLLIRELNQLKKGVMEVINGKYYFVQAILKKEIFDTKEFENVLGVNVSRSNAGCFFCNSLHGFKRPLMNNMSYVGHRGFLPIDNYLRSFTQSLLCCPRRYYTSKNVFQTVVPISPADNKLVIAEEDTINDENIQSTNITDLRKRPIQFNKFVDSICSEDVRAFFKEHDRFNQRKIGFSSVHKNIDLTSFKNDLFYHHADYRKPLRYRRTNNKQYKEAYKSKKRGVKRLWYFHKYRSNVKTDVCYDPMHTAKNHAIYMVDNFKGKRLNAGAALYCRSINCHPKLYPFIKTSMCTDTYREKDDEKEKKKQDKKFKKKASQEEKKKLETEKQQKKQEASEYTTKLRHTPFSVPDNFLKTAEAWLDAIIVPCSYSHEYQIKQIFSCAGMMRAESWMKWISSYMHFTMSAFKEYSPSLKKWHSMYAQDFIELYSNVIYNDKQVLDDLFLKACETAAIHEGLYPEYELAANWHNYVCMAMQLPEFGPMYLWWCFEGERILGEIKEHKPRGGGAVAKVIFERSLKSEMANMIVQYDFDLERFDEIKSEHPVFGSRPHQFAIDRINLTFTDEAFKLSHPIVLNTAKKGSINTIVFTVLELDNLVEVLCRSVQKRCGDFDRCFSACSLFRWYYYFFDLNEQKFKKQVYNRANPSFIIWAREVISHFADTNSFVNKKLKYVPKLHASQVCRKITDNDEFYFVTKTDLKLLCVIAGYDSIQCGLYSEATIFGVKFKSRGVECRETNDAEIQHWRYGSDDPYDDRHWPNLHHNELSNNWSKLNHYSSWMKIRGDPQKPILSGDFNDDSFYGTSLYDDERNYLYAQANFYFNVYLPEDPFLNGVELASVTCRRHVRVNFVDYIIASNDGFSFLPNKMFCVLDDVYSSAITQCAFTSSFKIIDKYLIHLQDVEEEQQKKNKRQQKVDSQRKSAISSSSSYSTFNNNVSSKKGYLNDETEDKASFQQQVTTIINRMMVQNPVPYYIGNDMEIASSSEYTKDDHSQISYLAMLPLHTTRKYVRYDDHFENTYYGSRNTSFCSTETNCVIMQVDDQN